MAPAALPRSRPRLGPLVFLAGQSLLGSRFTFALLVIAVAAGAGFQIPNTANLAGFAAALLEEEITHGAGDVRVEPRDEPRFKDGSAEAARVTEAAGPGVRAVVPVLVLPGAAGGKGGRFQNALIYGLYFTGTAEIHPFHLKEGALLEKGDANGVLIGASLAARVGAKVGGPVDLRVILDGGGGARGGEGAEEARARAEGAGGFTMTVRGLVVGSAGGYRSVFVDRSVLAEKAGAAGAATSVFVHVDDHFAARRVAARIKERLPDVRAVD